MAEVKIEGLEELNEALLALPEEVRKEILTAAVDAAAEIVKAEAVRLAPRASGKLADSITVREAKARPGEDVRRLIGPTGVPYAAFQEFGTSRNRAHPYMRPAHDERKQLDDIEREGRSAIPIPRPDPVRMADASLAVGEVRTDSVTRKWPPSTVRSNAGPAQHRIRFCVSTPRCTQVSSFRRNHWR
jgi:HK97 gp10 family phage protein